VTKAAASGIQALAFPVLGCHSSTFCQRSALRSRTGGPGLRSTVNVFVWVESGKEELQVTQKFVELLPQIQSSNARFSLNR
jgi:hypothetical protein